jgi:hypothetical protein
MSAIGFGYLSRQGAKTLSSEEKIVIERFTSSYPTFAPLRLCERHSSFDYFFSSAVTARDAEWIGTVASRNE